MREKSLDVLASTAVTQEDNNLRSLRSSLQPNQDVINEHLN